MTNRTTPQEWKSADLMDLVTIRSGQVDPKKPAYRRLPLIAPDHIASATGRLLKKETAASQGAISGKYLVEPGDVIYSKIRPYLQKAYKCDFTALCSADMYPLTPKQGVDGSFVLHILLGEDFTNFATSVSARSGIPKINRTELAEYALYVPSNDEQRAIGSALDHADEMIAMLERLMAKKRAIKQGMMQQLLTGKTRLPGFSNPWLERTLGDLGKTYGGLSGKSAADFGSGNGRFITFMDVMANVRVDGTRLAAVRVAAQEKQNTVAVGDVLFNGSSETPEELALSSVVISAESRTYLNSFCFGFRPRSNEVIDSEFLAYLFRGTPGRNLLQALAQGSTRYNLSKSKFRQLRLRMPDVEEQTAIARVLGETDDEIEVLVNRLHKAKAIKHGMMQALLNGRSRLPVAEAVS